MKIVAIINTAGLIYDDRLMKECTSLKELKADVKIIAFEKKNKSEKGVYLGIPYETVRLATRKLLFKRGLKVIAVIELLLKSLLQVLKCRGKVVWLHNIEMRGAAVLAVILKKAGYLKGVVWDQHELPSDNVYKSQFQRWLFRSTCKRCDFVISANEPRQDLIIEQFNQEQYRNKFLVINNYPTEDIITSEKRALAEHIQSWLQGKEYLLFQGYAREERCVLECARAAYELPAYKLMLVGPIPDNLKDEVQSIYGDSFQERVFVVGRVPQDDLYKYIDNCFLSLIFYAQTNDNNWLCEPNRFYQALCRRKPVVCGANPPMRMIVDKYHCGHAVSDDGKNYLGIKEGIEDVARNHHEISQNLEAAYDKLTWRANDNTFSKLVNHFLSAH